MDSFFKICDRPYQSQAKSEILEVRIFVDCITGVLEK